VTTPQDSRSLNYQPGLDGLRALSVLGVILYHAGYNWIPGGFLGVEVFFVVSGYLITSLLVEEWRNAGDINLRRFWTRRARRLLPALFVMLFVTCAYAALFVPDARNQLRGDSVAALAYVTNWWQIASHQSYFGALGRPPLLRHLWSLAVEEQWYLMWPLVFRFAMRRVRGRARVLAPIALAAAFLSAIEMAVLFHPADDPSRVYYGTDTRAAGLLVGASLAFVWAPWKWQRARERHLVAVDVVGVAAIALLVVAFFEFDQSGYFGQQDRLGPVLYRGGFLVVSLLSAVAIAAVVHPGARLLRAGMGAKPLVWVGLRSYGLYLWHWPVFMVTTPQDVPLDGPALFVFRLVITFALTEASYRFVELPIRGGAIGRYLERARASGDDERVEILAPVRLAVVSGGIVIGLIGVQLAVAPRFDQLTGGTATTTANVIVTPTSTSSIAGSTGAALGRPLRVVVVGDSQANALTINAPVSLASTIALTNGALDGCGVVDKGTMKSSSRVRRSFRDCVGFQDKWAAKASAAHADIALVVLGAWEVFDLSTKDGALTFGTQTHDDYLLDRVHAGIEALRSSGANVGLLEVPCYRPITVKGGLPALPERGDDRRTRHLNDVLRRAAAADPAHVSFIEGPQDFCTNESLATDTGYRWDGVHYYKPGSKLVFDKITPELLAIPLPN
jgi:peptidoglycan/LPS O-acetylase OafA/YrhL